MNKAGVEQGQNRPTSYDATSPGSATNSCLNCGAALGGPFCASCGQRNIPPYPSVRELVVDAFWELSGWDGRFSATVRGLVRKPGLLTIEFLQGRRARYISPLRLYLMASLVYFLTAAAVPSLHSGTAVEAGGFRIGLFTSGTAADTARGEGRRQVNPRTQQITPEEQKELLASIEEAPAFVRPMLRRAMNDPGGYQRALFEAMPRMLFALLPLFAGILALFYRGRKYPVHLYFAIHLHAFIFLALTLSELAKLTGSTKLGVIVGIPVVLWMPLYTHLALRRVYGDSQGRTLAKEVGIGAIYVICSVPALIGLTMWAARA